MSEKMMPYTRATMNAPAVPREMPLMVMRPSAYPSTAIISTENIRKDMPEMVTTPPNKLMIIYLAFLYFLQCVILLTMSCVSILLFFYGVK